MKIILFILSLFVFDNLFSQQTIEKCDGDRMSFTYSSISTENGPIDWTVNNQGFYTVDLTVDWSTYPLGTHIISAVQGGPFCPSDTVYYTVNLVGCPYSTMWAPNTFTPDGDEYNNVWSPQGYNYFDEHFYIVNRWGEILFESYDLNVGWDGSYLGKPCQQDVYVYVLEWKDIDNRYQIRYGHVTLLR